MFDQLGLGWVVGQFAVVLLQGLVAGDRLEYLLEIRITSELCGLLIIILKKLFEGEWLTTALVIRLVKVWSFC